MLLEGRPRKRNDKILRALLSYNIQVSGLKSFFLESLLPKNHLVGGDSLSILLG